MKVKQTVLVMLLIFISTTLYGVDNIKIYTENYPPYNMNKEGKLTGSSVDILEEMLKRAKLKQTKDDIKLSAWSRGYSMAKMKKNNMIFSTTRTKHREEFFKWVGPISKTKIGLIALKSNDIKIKDIKDLNNYKIGAVIKDIGEQLLLENGVAKNKIQSISGKDVVNLSFRKLKNKRIDLFAYELNVAKYTAKLKGFDMDKYEVVYTLKEGDLYYAFNKNSDEVIIDKLQKALDSMKKDGTYEKILSLY